MSEPKDVMAYKKGVLLFKQGKALEAMKYFKYAANTGEDRPMEHFALAAAYMRVGDLTGAEKEYSQFLAMDSGMSKQEHVARKVLSRFAADRDTAMAKRAADDILQAEQEAVRMAAVEELKAAEEARLRVEEEARQKAEEDVRRKRLEDVEKLYEEAVAFYRGGGFDSAIARLETLGEKWGRTAEVLNLMGLCRMGQGKNGVALELLQEAHDEDRENVDVMLNLAQLHFETGIARARPLIEQVTGHQPGNAGAWFNLGVLLLASGDKAGARQAWQRAYQIDPNDERIVTGLEMVTGRTS
jgi:tetratricopeptide (TPR) repeat protein